MGGRGEAQGRFLQRQVGVKAACQLSSCGWDGLDKEAPSAEGRTFWALGNCCRPPEPAGSPDFRAGLDVGTAGRVLPRTSPST